MTHNILCHRVRIEMRPCPCSIDSLALFFFWSAVSCGARNSDIAEGLCEKVDRGQKGLIGIWCYFGGLYHLEIG